MRRASGILVLWALIAGISGCGSAHPDAEPEVLSGVAALAAGDGYSCALMADTTVRCWGKGILRHPGKVIQARSGGVDCGGDGG
jgi:Regulator of chromosome condensation (RCC1) repeat